MRISKEEALEHANAAKKLHTVKKGQVWLFCPYMPGASYHSVHWDPSIKESVQCEGDKCIYCPKTPNRKAHVPCMLFKRPYRLHEEPTLRFPQDIICDQHWTPKIIELTSNCLRPLNLPSDPDQLAIAWRPGEKTNGTLFFRWIEGHLKGVPAELAELDVAKILPGVIGGTYRDYQERTLDNELEGRIKHNSNSPTKSLQSLQSEFESRFSSFAENIGLDVKGGW